MDQEKNLNEEITETTQEVVEEVVEAAEEVATEIAEELEERVRPVVYDDFSEEEEVAPQKKESKGIGFGGLAVSTIISSLISVCVTLFILFLVNAIPALFTAVQIDGVWALDMTEYEMGHIYVVFDDGKMTLTSEQNGQMFTCDYDVTEKETIELTADENNMMMVSQLVGTTELKVKYDKKADSLTFSPAIGGVATWEGVEREVEKSVIEGLKNPEVIPEFEDITETPVE